MVDRIRIYQNPSADCNWNFKNNFASIEYVIVNISRAPIPIQLYSQRFYILILCMDSPERVIPLFILSSTFFQSTRNINFIISVPCWWNLKQYFSGILIIQNGTKCKIFLFRLPIKSQDAVAKEIFVKSANFAYRIFFKIEIKIVI